MCFNDCRLPLTRDFQRFKTIDSAESTFSSLESKTGNVSAHTKFPHMFFRVSTAFLGEDFSVLAHLAFRVSLACLGRRFRYLASFFVLLVWRGAFRFVFS